jgi:hypothetical protein
MKARRRAVLLHWVAGAGQLAVASRYRQLRCPRKGCHRSARVAVAASLCKASVVLSLLQGLLHWQGCLSSSARLGYGNGAVAAASPCSDEDAQVGQANGV